jgi:hypothetical protein
LEDTAGSNAGGFLSGRFSWKMGNIVELFHVEHNVTTILDAR